MVFPVLGVAVAIVVGAGDISTAARLDAVGVDGSPRRYGRARVDLVAPDDALAAVAEGWLPANRDVWPRMGQMSRMATARNGTRRCLPWPVSPPDCAPATAIAALWEIAAVPLAVGVEAGGLADDGRLHAGVLIARGNRRRESADPD